MQYDKKNQRNLHENTKFNTKLQQIYKFTQKLEKCNRKFIHLGKQLKNLLVNLKNLIEDESI